jgi:hypothetical protein
VFISPATSLMEFVRGHSVFLKIRVNTRLASRLTSRLVVWVVSFSLR